jgi:glutamate-1-semialdehyde 2,1-aminomutase
VTDVDGREYVDLVGSWGPLILGHAHPEVVAAVTEQARHGTSFGAPTELELEMARTVVRLIPSVEQVRLVSSGTEATMSALRLARAATGRDRILKFEGCYHGHADALLVKAGSGALTLGVPDSPGVPGVLARLTMVARYNDVEGVRGLLRSEGSEIAAVIVEPVAGNMGVVGPKPGFLEMLREETRRAGVVLIFDEVITGFRLGLGGAQSRFGIDPDLTCLGKVLGGGMPLAAFGGSRALMEQLAPVGPVYQAGTLSGNPVSVAAGLTTLRLLEQTPDAYGRLERIGALASDVLQAALAATGVPGCVNRVGSMLTLFLGVTWVEGFSEACRADQALFARYFRGMLERGFYLPPSQFEAMFVSLAHTEADVEALGRAARHVLGAAGT